jgi:TRAP-type C4-dicarboxylate transport system permease small subunit
MLRDPATVIDQNDAQVPPSPVSTRGVLAALDRVIEAVALALFVVMMAAVLLQVLGRFAHFAVMWTEELARVLLVASSILAIAVGVRRRDHIIVDYFVDRLGPASRHRLGIALDIVLLLFLILWLRGAVGLATLNAGTAYVTVPWLAVSDLYVAEAVAILAMMLFVAADLATRLRGARRP